MDKSEVREELYNFTIRFRERIKDHYGTNKGNYIFGCYAASIISKFCLGVSEDDIFETLLEWSDDSLWEKIIARTSTGCFDKNGVELFLGDKVRYNLEGIHTKKEYWNPEYEIIWKAPSFTLNHIGGGRDGGSYDFKLRCGGTNGDLEKIS